MKIDACRQCVEFASKLGAGSLDSTSSHYRVEGAASSVLCVVSKRQVGNLRSGVSLKDHMKVFCDSVPEEFVLGRSGNKVTLTDSGDEVVRLASVSDSHSQFYAWFDHFSKNCGDWHPDKVNGTILITSPSRIAVYNDYVDDCHTSVTVDPIGLKEFYSAWDLYFSNVKLRDYCGLLGKCHFCALIESLCLRKGDSFKNHQYATILHGMHRGGYYGSSRQKYAEEIEYGRRNQESTINIDVDIMAQDVLTNPFVGTRSTLSNTISSGLIGVLEHNFGPHLYHFYDTVHKCASLVCHVILDVIEKWFVRKGRYPDKVLLNVDGGGENASEVVLALLEFIVHKRVALEVTFFRNPPGHTHGPIDGRFSGVKKAITTRGFVGTLDDLKDLLETEGLFKGVTTLTNLDAVPDYRSLFAPVIDPYLGRLHKSYLTQLVWWFQAVEVSDLLPSGVKVLYRAHAADETTELMQYKGSSPRTKICQETGIDTVYTFVEWKPLARDQPTRNCDGMYLLHKLPQNCSPEPTIVPLAFPSGFDPSRFHGVQRDINNYFCQDTEDHIQVRTWWSRFFRERAPTTTSVMEYSRSHYIKTSLPQLFMSGFRVQRDICSHVPLYSPMQTAETAKHIAEASYYSYALNSVEWYHDSHLLWGSYRPPRHMVLSSERLRSLAGEFEKWLKGLKGPDDRISKTTLDNLYKRQCLLSNQNCVAYNINTIANTKASITDMHVYFYASLVTECCESVVTDRYEKFCRQQVDDDEGEVSSYTTTDGRRSSIFGYTIRAFISKTTMDTSVMSIFMHLFQVRDERIEAEIVSVQKTYASNIKIFGKTKFCSGNFYDNLTLSRSDLCDRELGGSTDRYTRVFIPCRHQHNSSHDWSLVVIVVTDRTNVVLSHISPLTELSTTLVPVKVVESEESITDTQLKVVYRYLKALNSSLCVRHEVYSKVSHRCPRVSCNGGNGILKEDTGVLVLIYASFIYNDCNIYIRADKGVLVDLKKKFACALIKGKLNTFN